MKQAKKMILEDSDDAACIRTVTGWVSSTGRFWGDDEGMARYDGATHRKCGKNQDHPVYEIRSYCRECYREAAHKRYLDMPRENWEGEPLVINDSETYFFDEDSLLDYCAENECQPQDLPLVICEPNYASRIESDYWCDDLPDDGELPADMEAALTALNEVIEKSPPLSWSQGKVAAIIPDDVRAEGDER